jgi:hypothetical protein
MYDIFTLPHDFLHRKFTQSETDAWDEAMHNAAFGKPVSEELTPSQKKTVMGWGQDYKAKRIHDKVFGEGKERIVIPYEGESDPITSADRNDNFGRGDVGPHTRAVLNALHSKGWHVDDYESGMASTIKKVGDPSRGIPLRDKQVNMSIGKVLASPEFKDHHVDFQETKTDENGNSVRGPDGTAVKHSVTRHISNVYEMDPTLKSKSVKKAIVITRNKYDVAGMSTGRRWPSCMNMVDGANKQYLPKDIQHGTLTAYLVAHNDHGIAEPIGRQNLKQFNNGSGHTIYSQESTSYGRFPRGAKKAVEEWAKANYPSEPGIYTKHHDLYDDDGRTHRFEKPDELKNIGHENLFKDLKHVAHSALNHPLPAEDHDAEGNFFGYDNRHEQAADNVEHMMRNHDFPARLAIKAHALINHAKTNPTGVEKYSGGVDGGATADDVMAHYARSTTLGTMGEQDRGMKSTPISDLMHLHKKIHETMGELDNPRAHHGLQSLHSHIIEGILNHPNTNDKINDEVLSDATQSYSGHYGTMMKPLDLEHQHPLSMIKNPRVAHRVYRDYEEGGLDHYGAHDGEDTMKNMGRIADAKLAHHVLTRSDEPKENIEHFVHGLNENPHGEAIQHAITDEPLSVGNQRAFEAIGEHTRHASVVNKIRTRADTNANNKVFMATQNNIVESTITFKEFIVL